MKQQTDRSFPSAGQGKSSFVILNQNSGAAIDSLVICKFTNMGVTDEYFASVLSVITGVQYATANLIKVGERVLNLERLYNNREGFTTKNDILLLRLLTEVPVDGMSKGWVSNLEPMLKEYYRTRGWNENGVPTRKKLTELGLAELA